MFGQDGMDDFSDLPERLIKPGSRGHEFCSALQISSWWKRLQSLTWEKKVATDEEGEEVGIEE